MKRALLWIVVGVAAAGLIVFAAWPRPRLVETAPCTAGEISVFITEEAETRLDRDYVVSMPVAGRLLRIGLDEGHIVTKGEVIARVDTFERDERLKTLHAQIREIKAEIEGVDEAKPKPEDIKVADLAVGEAAARHAAAKKALEEARINFDQEQKQFARVKALYEERTVTKAEFDEAQRRYLTLKSKVDEAGLGADVAAKVMEQAQVRLKRLRDSKDDNEYQRRAYLARIDRINHEIAIIEDELRKCEVKAPVTGPVLEKTKDDEQVLAAGTQLLKIGDLESICIESDILSEEVGGVREKAPVEIFGPAIGDRTVVGAVDRIFPSGFEKISSLGIEQQRVKIIVTFDNSDLNLRPGVRLDIRIVTSHKDRALQVPDRVLFKVRGRWHVMAVRDGRARLAPVTIGLRNDEHAEILDGLAEGDRVILSPPADLTDGEAVVAEDVPDQATGS